MIEVKEKVKRISNSDAVSAIYALCNKKQYFTSGTVSSYDKMFSLVKEGRPVQEIAVAIWICSSESFTLSEISKEVEKALYKEV